jgi:hypothetical protein
MKKIINRKSVILMSSGMFIIAVSQIFSHFVELPDWFILDWWNFIMAIIGKYRTAQ